MNIALTFNVRHTKPSLNDRQAMEEAEFDEPSTIRGITRALRNLGHRVFLIEADDKAFSRLKRLKPRIDLVFNIAEGIWGQDRESQIPAILELLQIPYVGSKPLTQAICLNKALTKEILLTHGIATPKFQLFETGQEKRRKDLRFPLLVKPNHEGSSKGIFQNSFIKNEKDLGKKIKGVIQDFKQPALVEEFLPGREFTVGIIGNNSIEVLPPVELDFHTLPKHFVPIDSYEVKWIIDNPESSIETVICPAKIDKKLLSEIQRMCLQAKKVLGVLDWCRIDIRLDAKSVPHIIEVNQIPGIIPDPRENSRFPLAARKAGYSFEEMLNKIIKAACSRYQINVS